MVALNIFSKAWTVNSRKTCCLIFLCEVVALTSFLCIGFVYVHVYVPNYNAKRFPTVPMVCSTISDQPVENCEFPDKAARKLIYSDSEDALKEIGHPESIISERLRSERNDSSVSSKYFQWSSCGEFCSPLVAEDKGCRQLRVDVRSPGSDLRLVKCGNIDVMECGFRTSRLYEYDSGDADLTRGCTSENNSTCHPLEGLYTCHIATPSIENNISTFECVKITTSWRCTLPTSPNDNNKGPSVQNCTSQSSTSLATCVRKPGLHFCNSGLCIMISNLQEMCNNTRKCDEIPLQGKNIIINHKNEGTIVTAKCYKGIHRQRNVEVWPRGFKNRQNPDIPPALLINCNHIILPPPEISTAPQQVKEWSIILGDCVNGTLLENVTLPAFSSLENLQEIWHEAITHEDFLLDPINQKHAPPESNLALFKNVRLYYSDFYKINGCNLLPPQIEEDKCGDFYENFARLPGDFRGQSLFPCFCRSTTKGPPYCIIGDREIFSKNWEDVLVQDWLVPYKVFVLTVLSILLGSSLTVVLVLVCPVITDSVQPFTAFVITRQNSQDVRHGLPPSIHGIHSRRPSVFLTPVSPVSINIKRV